MGTSKNSDKISTFLTSPEGDPASGIRAIRPYVFRMVNAWARELGAGTYPPRFLEPGPSLPESNLKLFYVLCGRNHLSHPGFRTTLDVEPGGLGVVRDGHAHLETWHPDAEGRFLQVFIGLAPGRLAINIAGSGSPYGCPEREGIYAGASVPYSEGKLLESFLDHLQRKESVPLHSAKTLADLITSAADSHPMAGRSPLVRSAVTSILDNPCNPDLSVQWLADRLSCHPDYLSRRFRDETGQTMVETIRERRMEVASDLLRGRRIPVADVATLCGYRDHSYFSRLFRQQHGVPPSAFH